MRSLNLSPIPPICKEQWTEIKNNVTHWMPLPTPPALCEICNGTGIIFIGCCSGNQCGCMGQPVAAKKCKCGKQIDESKMTNDEFFIFEHVEYLEDTP